jgi:hypothetical protein
MQLSLMSIDDLASSSAGINDTLHETSHDLLKDAMLEKVILIAVAYFCIATEMRLMSTSKRNIRKDSEGYHAKALHLSSIFLPKECPLVQHLTSSYKRNYMKEKKEADKSGNGVPQWWTEDQAQVDAYLKELGVEFSDSSSSSSSEMEKK